MLKGDGPVDATAEEVFNLARLIFAEAAQDFRVQGAFEAIASVVLNRVRSRFFPDTLNGVIFQSGAFDAATGAFRRQDGATVIGNGLFNDAADPSRLGGVNALAFARAVTIASLAVAGELPDPTGGATLFFAGNEPPRGFFAAALRSGRVRIGVRIGSTTFVCDMQER